MNPSISVNEEFICKEAGQEALSQIKTEINNEEQDINSPGVLALVDILPTENDANQADLTLRPHRRQSIIKLPLKIELSGNALNISALASNKKIRNKPLLTLFLEQSNFEQHLSQQSRVSKSLVEPNTPSEHSAKQFYEERQEAFKRLCLATPPQNIRAVKQ